MFNYLIMTPLGKFEIPVSAYKIFLGEWCIDYDDNNLAKNSVLAHYHWDDRQKLYKDYIYILELYEKITCEVNEIFE